jgi:hypothetical protein
MLVNSADMNSARDKSGSRLLQDVAADHRNQIGLLEVVIKRVTAPGIRLCFVSKRRAARQHHCAPDRTCAENPGSGIQPVRCRCGDGLHDKASAAVQLTLMGRKSRRE